MKGIQLVSHHIYYLTNTQPYTSYENQMCALHTAPKTKRPSIMALLINMVKQPEGVNNTPLVGQHDMLSDKWGDFNVSYAEAF